MGNPGDPNRFAGFVDDIEAARTELVGRGVEGSETFHDVGGAFHHGGDQGRMPGPDPQRTSYGSFASFQVGRQRMALQEMTTRLPGR